MQSLQLIMHDWVIYDESAKNNEKLYLLGLDDEKEVFA